jgi:hypothetical protein
MHNQQPGSGEEVEGRVSRGFDRISRRPDFLLSFFHHAGLSVNPLLDFQ